MAFAFICAAFLPLSCDGVGSVDVGGDIVEAIEKSRTTQITFYDKDPSDPTAKSVSVRYKFEEVVNLNTDYPKNLNVGNAPKGWTYIDLQGTGTGTPSNISTNGGETIVNITQRDLCFYATGWEHFHTIATEWTYDATHHWHAATCGVEEHMSKAEHTASSPDWETDADRHWQKCTVCEAVFNKNAHDWGTPIITSASCTDDGTKTYRCVCGKSKTETIPATGHTYGTTWTTDGSKHWHAATCEHTSEIKDEAAHTLTVWQTNDSKHWKECTVCNAKLEEANHIWDAGVVTTAATCSVTGVRTYTCTECGKTKTETIGKTAHPYSTDWTSDATNHWHAATCVHTSEIKDKATHTADTSMWKNDTTNHWRECSVCGAEVASTKTAHSWGTGEVTTEPTCSATGVKTYTCACGKTKTEAIPANGHTTDTSIWKNSTTHHWRECSVCGAEVASTKAAHTYATAWTTDDDYHWHKCSVCGAAGTKTEHSATSWENDDEKHWKECDVCTETFNEAEHTPNTSVWEKDDTKHWRTCSDCEADMASTEAEHTMNWNTAKSKYVCSKCALEKGELLPGEVAEYLSNCSGDNVPLKVKATSSNDLRNIKTSLKANTNVTGVNLEITGDITTIGGGAFQNCTSLTSVTIPNTVTSIGDYAFEGCSSLTSVTIPNTVTSIGNYAFHSCTSLPSITIPENVTRIGKYAFSGCTSLPSVTIPDGVTSIGDATFGGCTSLTSVTIPDSVTTIGGSAFSGCTSLPSVTIPKDVTSIGDFAFNGCTSLASVKVEATTPPTLGTTIFNNNATDRKIYVPSGSVSTYKSATGWTTYSTKIDAIIP